MPPRSSPINAVQKACRILSSLSGAESARLTEIATATSLNKATALRILDTLAKEGFVSRDEGAKTWALGEEAYVLAAAASRGDMVRTQARPSLMRLAATSQDTVLLSIRRGTQSVCVDREIGDYPIRANYLDIGVRRPLGVGAGSLALLAWLPDTEIEAVLQLVKTQLSRYPKITPRWVQDEIQRSRERGYTLILDRIVERMGGIGIPILAGDGRPIAAISIAALSERISARLEILVGALRKEAEIIASLRQEPQRREAASAEDPDTGKKKARASAKRAAR